MKVGAGICDSCMILRVHVLNTPSVEALIRNLAEFPLNALHMYNCTILHVASLEFLQFLDQMNRYTNRQCYTRPHKNRVDTELPCRAVKAVVVCVYGGHGKDNHDNADAESADDDDDDVSAHYVIL